MRIFGLTLLASFAATPALAQKDAPPSATNGEFDGNHLVLGIGVARLPDYDGSNDYSWSPVPAAVGSLAGFNFQLVGTQLSVDLIRDGRGEGGGWDIQLGPVAVVNMNRASTGSIADPRIKALGRIDTAIELGGYVGIGRVGVLTSDHDRLSLTASYRHDVSGVSDAGVFTPSVSYMTPLSRKAMVVTYLSALRVEKGYATTYFGITPAGSAASGLPVWNPRGGWKSWTAGLGGMISLTGDLTHGLQLAAGGTYSRMLNDFGASPIVAIAGSRDQWIGTLGLAYSF